MIDIGDLTYDEQERMCSLCEDCVYGHTVNTGPHNLCEGSRCEEAFIYLEEEFEIERYDRLRYLLIC